MSAPTSVIFVGGPGSGKSNYLFRTWIALERRNSRLSAAGLPEDVDYLHSGASILLDGRFAPHTSKDTRVISEIPIRTHDVKEAEGVLVVPDATGELWLDLYHSREWPQQWDSLLSRQSSYILFICIGSNHNVPALDWITCERLYGSGVAPQPTDVPTQVLLVEWLQILRSIVNLREGHAHKPRLSVVLTAWDRLPADRRQESPQNFLETEFPLFAQFLRADAHGFEVKVFGVSIVGGDLERDPDFQKAYQQSDPSGLGYSVSDAARGVEQSEVLLPIYWALGV